LVGKPEGKRQQKQKVIYEDNNKTELKETECENVKHIHWLRIGTSDRFM
jgi:hypothetical protein